MVWLVLFFALVGTAVQAEDDNFTFTQPLVEAADNGDVATVGALLTQGTSPDIRAQFGVTGLMRAVYRGHETVAKLLLQAGADVNAVDQGGATALHIASRQGRVALVHLLLEAHADVNATDDNSWTPLMRATMGRHVAVVKALLKAKANILFENRWKQNALDILAQSGNMALLQLYEQALQGKTLPTSVSAKMEQYAKWNPNAEFRDKVAAFTGKQVDTALAALEHSMPNADPVKEVDVKEKVEVLPVLSLEDKPNIPTQALSVLPAPTAPPENTVTAENVVPAGESPTPPVVKTEVVATNVSTPYMRHISSYPPEMRPLVEEERKKEGKMATPSAIETTAPTLPVIALPAVQDFAVESPQIQEAKAEIQLNPAPEVASQTVPETVPIVPLISEAAPDPTATMEKRATTLYAKERSQRTDSIAAYEGARHEPRRYIPSATMTSVPQSMAPVQTMTPRNMAEPVAMAPLMEVNPPAPTEVPVTPLPVMLDTPNASTIIPPATPRALPSTGYHTDSIAMAPLMDVNPAPVAQATILPIIEEDSTIAMPQRNDQTVPIAPKKSSLIQVAKPIRVTKGKAIAEGASVSPPKPSMTPSPANVPFGAATPALPQASQENVLPKPIQKHVHAEGHGHHPHKKAGHPHTVLASDQLIYPVWITSAYFANAELASGVVDALTKMPEMAAYQIWVVELSGDAGYGLRIGSFSTKSGVKEACSIIRRLRHLKTPMQGSCMLEVQQADRSFVPAQSVIKR